MKGSHIQKEGTDGDLKVATGQVDTRQRQVGEGERSGRGGASLRSLMSDWCLLVTAWLSVKDRYFLEGTFREQKWEADLQLGSPAEGAQKLPHTPHRMA